MAEASAPQKKRRSYGAKSKFGCRTCRCVRQCPGTRRYKCDETRPRCLRCVKDGFECEGFPARPMAPGLAAGRQILPKYTSSASGGSSTQLLPRPIARMPGIPIKPRTVPFEQNLEYQYFREFNDRTAGHLMGYYDEGVWKRIVPQICHQEASIRHITVALAAVNMTITAITDSNTAVTSKESRRKEAWRHTAFGLKHYAKALALMRRLSFADLSDEYQLRNALLTCFLTMTFEFYQGNKETAAGQGAMGIELLNRFHERRFGERPKAIADIPATATIDSDIIDTFAHIENLLALGAKRSEEIEFDANAASKFLEDIPGEFLDLETAQKLWVLTQIPGMYWSSSGSGSMDSREDGAFLFDISSPDFAKDIPLITLIPIKKEAKDDSSPELTSEAEEVVRTAVTDADTKQEGGPKWFDAFQPLYEKCRSQDPTTKDYQKATLLMMRYLAGKLRFTDTNIDHDFLPESAELIFLARDLFERAAPPGEDRLKQITEFLVDGVVAALFLVAVKCQDSKARRDAIELLKQYSGVEGYWDSTLAATVAAWFVEKEEAIEEGSMVSRFVIEYIYSLPERKVSICLSKQLRDEPHRIITPPYTLNW